ncbi:hypothetical protein ABG067_004217 [Albugo candida]
MSKDVTQQSAKEKAQAKKQIKNLKSKDVKKKRLGIDYCLENSYFVREEEQVVPLLMSFIAQVKVCTISCGWSILD